MGEESAGLIVLTDGEMAEANLSKRSHECIVDDIGLEVSPSKKQAKENSSNDESNSEVLNPNVSLQENASHSPTSSSQFVDGSSRPACGDIPSPCVISACGDIPSISTGNSSTESTDNEDQCRSAGNSSTESTDNEDQCRNVASTSLTTTPPEVILEDSKLTTSSGIKRIIFRFSKSKDLNNGISSSTIQHRSSGFDNDLSYSRFHVGPDTSTDMAVGTSGVDFYESKSMHNYVPRMELKMSKKVELDSYPTSVRRLLSTGILERIPVKYIRGEKLLLRGIIKGCGYLCGCSTCNFSKVLNAYEFEQHAGSSTKHPNNFIYLDNGKSIHSVVHQLRDTPLCMLDEVIQDVAGPSINENSYQAWKESFETENLQRIEEKSEEDEQSHSKFLEFSQPFISFRSQAGMDNFAPSRSLVPKYPVKQIRSMMQEETYVHKRPKMPSHSCRPKTGFTNSGRVKKRDNDLHRLLFLPNGLPDGAELTYYSRGQRLLEGYKQGNGIVCSCCDSEISPSQFEAHAGWAARRQPYRHIYTSNGSSLHDLSLSLASGQNLATSNTADMCTVCGDGGDLILCDGCPRAFHTVCLESQCSPDGVWHCPYCKDTIGMGGRAAFDDSSGSVRPITIRSSRVVKAPAAEIGGCVVCRCHDFSASKFDERTVMLCDQCEKEYHVGCLRDCGLCDLKELPKGKWFCCEDCNRIHDDLQNLIFSGPKEIPTLLYSAITKKLIEKGLTDEVGADVQWELISGKFGSLDQRSLLSKAAAIFRDGFDPIVWSGRDLIPAMVYGRNIAGQEFGGMYCAVLSVESVVVSAGILRIFGPEVAELPLVATIKHSQGKGYFQALFSCIERLLFYLNVENLVLPAAEEAESIWTNKFGFTKMTEERLQKYTKDFLLTVFKSTSMLEKVVPRIVDESQLDSP